MLYDPKWEVQDITYTPQGLLAWLDKQPREKKYDWASFNCLVCQYLKFVGDSNWNNYLKVQGKGVGFALNKPWTFGAAADRLREAL